MSFMGLLVTSCTSSSPGDAFKNYMELVKKKDYKTLAQGFAIDESQTPEQQAQATEMIEGLLTEKADKAIAEKGGLKDVQVLEEKISEDGNTADLKVKLIYGNGTEDETAQQMVKQNDQWKMVFKK